MALTPDKTRVEHGLTIHEKIIPWGALWVKTVVVGKTTYYKGNKYKADRLLSGGTGKVGGVTIHNTDGGANAETYTRATYPNQNMKDCRVHYYVDDKEGWQNLLETEVGWHAGDGRGSGNETTISIEIIMRGKAIANDDASEDNGAKLAAILLVRHGLGIEKLYKHKDWSGKQCPLYIIPHWDAFKAKVQTYMAQFSGVTTTPATETPAAPAYYRVRKEWTDSKTQIGAYTVFENAKKTADDNKAAGYKVFDASGAVAYAPDTAAPPVTPVTTPDPVDPVDQTIWDYFTGKGLNAYAVAGIMGNLYAESALKPTNLQNSYEKSLGMTDAEYTAAVDNGEYTNFANDKAGYGLAQWTFGSRKAALLTFANEAGASIGSLTVQLDFMWNELQGYTGVMAVLKAATSVLEASNAILLQYEKPADQSEAAQARRAGYGQPYLEKFSNIHDGTKPTPPPVTPPEPEPPAPELDNTPAEWEKKAVEAALSRGIIRGDTSGDLKLHGTATRADVLVFLERAGVL